MKFYLIVSAITLLMSSCLKESIPNAMLAEKSSASGGGTATISYEVNGNPVKITVANADNQDPNYYELGCSNWGIYNGYGISALTDKGELAFPFFTDSLTTGEYTYTGIYGEKFFINYNGQSEYAQAPSDYLTFIITSYDKGHISGTFSGKLTPLITAGTISNLYGASSSILITKGLFNNVPVFY